MAKGKSLMTPVPSRTDKTAARPASAAASPVAEVAPAEERVVSATPKSTVSAMPFGAANYRLMAIGLAVILAGFFIMTLDKEEFGFGFLGLTLGPLVVLSGFIIEFFAILKNPKA
ncbi:DUF3098 domain-containing protein [Rudanella paleaurantiibacter]|uniref:DUF3098 domain-containing protein n=1 Tax=Rudanella paleaurantiibacter TaxID=2614655 RepID=A0A7J5U4P4_9BACT|nr:DUF3098 domain-containing protein [Rudanella paleaurantiibacter]KAB7732691.1 DUF3098 domain-containing protein [Rudanella paleaurantiibacter]